MHMNCAVAIGCACIVCFDAVTPVKLCAMRDAYQLKFTANREGLQRPELDTLMPMCRRCMQACPASCMHALLQGKVGLLHAAPQ